MINSSFSRKSSLSTLYWVNYIFRCGEIYSSISIQIEKNDPFDVKRLLSCFFCWTQCNYNNNVTQLSKYLFLLPSVYNMLKKYINNLFTFIFIYVSILYLWHTHTHTHTHIYTYFIYIIGGAKICLFFRIFLLYMPNYMQ